MFLLLFVRILHPKSKEENPNEIKWKGNTDDFHHRRIRFGGRGGGDYDEGRREVDFREEMRFAPTGSNPLHN
ncbi:hypothetical protein KFK09_010909 [Dendrobium nobile]|uniref:Uncharacterized protein n=1 Tax=Dendrobium nobile TaxID=94219 RepID=A0A8T3BGX5_DENNO|nr:hypothetical protein KFK09_010909 [Dendrobium nobile]